MATLYFPTLTNEPIELDVSDFVPAPECDTEGNPTFWFGHALVLFSYRKSVHYVCVLSRFNIKTGRWRSALHGTCTADAFKAFAEYYYDNI